MTNPPANPPPVPTETFYSGYRTYRNSRTFGMIASMLMASSPFVIGVYYHLTAGKIGSLPVPVVYLVAAFFLLAAFGVISKSVRNVRELFQVDAQGVRARHNFWYWTQVKSLKPQKVSFASKYYIRVDLNVDPRVCILMPDEALTPPQYAEFLGRLRPFLNVNYPPIESIAPSQ